jgi:hypothetical protein
VSFDLLHLISVKLRFEFSGAGNLLSVAIPRATALSIACCGISTAIRARDSYLYLVQ